MVEEKKAMGLTVLGSDMAKKITVLDAIHMAVEAWGKVKQSAIHNCFKECLSDHLRTCAGYPVSIKAITVGTDTQYQ